MSYIKESNAGSALCNRAVARGVPPRCRLSDAGSATTLAEAVAGCSIEGLPGASRARSVPISCERQFPAVSCCERCSMVLSWGGKPLAGFLAPHSVCLSGEMADQIALDGPKATVPASEAAHALGSTGVAFDVRDGMAGLPALDIAAPGKLRCTNA